MEKESTDKPCHVSHNSYYFITNSEYCQPYFVIFGQIIAGLGNKLTAKLSRLYTTVPFCVYLLKMQGKIEFCKSGYFK